MTIKDNWSDGQKVNAADLNAVAEAVNTVVADDAGDDAAIAGKYTKPGGGIPSTDLAAAVQASLNKADTALQTASAEVAAEVASQVPPAAATAVNAYLATADVTLVDVGAGQWQVEIGGIPAGDPFTFDAIAIENIVGHYEAEAIDLFDRMSVRPDFNRRYAINTLIASLKDYGLWTRLDGLYMFAAHTSQAALLNWRRTSANMSAVNSPIFTADVGFTGDAGAAYLTNTSAATVHTQATDIAMSLWLKTKKTLGSWDISWSGWDARISADSNTVGWRLSEATGDNVTISDANQPGLYTIARVTASEERIYKDGGLAKSNTRAYNSGASYTTTLPIYLGVTSGTSGFTNGTYSFCSYGASMNTSEAALFYNAVNTYMDAVGVV